LFGGIEVGLQALINLNIPIKEYHTYEIYKPAIELSSKRFPFIVHHGSVINADFKQFRDFDLVIGGSPCQNNSRVRQENKSINSGLKGEKSSLFWEFDRAIKIIKPKWFMLENVVLNHKDDENTISNELGVRPILINSNLFSAQDRIRNYWTNIVPPPLPESCSIMLKDIMESDVNERYFYDKSFVMNGYDKKIIATLNVNTHDMLKRVYNPNFKCGTLTCVTGGYQEKKVLDKGRVRKLTPIEYERLQTLPDNYTYGFSDNVRYTLCGNAWTKDVIKHIFKGLIT